MLYAILMLLVLPPSTVDNAPSSINGVVRQLRTRHNSLDTIQCEYTSQTTASDFMIKTRSEADGRPLEQVRRQYESGPVKCTFEETKTGSFLAEMTRLNTAGQPQDRRWLSYDGKESFLVTALFSEGEIGFSDVKLKENAREKYDIEVMVRRLLGDTVLSSTEQTLVENRPLFAQMESAKVRELLPSETIKDAHCVVVRWQAHSDSANRETVWLDTGHTLVVRKYVKESRPPGADKWNLSAQWDVETIAATAVSRTAKVPNSYWFPREVACKFYDPSGPVIIENRVRILRVTLNSDIPAARFTPRIEDGANVMDRSTGQCFVYGGGPSPRLRRMIEKQVGASKQHLASTVNTEDADRVLTVRRRWTGVVSWAALGFGVVGLLVAAFMRRRA